MADARERARQLAAAADVPFKWQKKTQYDRKIGKTSQDREKIRRETDRELEKLRLAREQRQREMEIREYQRRQLLQASEETKLGDWREKEREFYLEQSKRRA